MQFHENGHSHGQLVIGSFTKTHSCIMSCAEFLAKHQITQAIQPLYSPDLAPCDFWLFPKLKSPLKGKRFQTVDEIQENMTEQLMAIPTKDFVDCFEQWKGCRVNCVRSQGAYFERNWGIIVLCSVFLISYIFFNKCLYFFILHDWVLSGQTFIIILIYY